MTSRAAGRPSDTSPVDGPARRSIAFLVWRDTQHPEGGGSELFVERVAEHLAATGWNVTMCVAAHPNAPRDEVRRGVRMRRRGGRLTVYLHGLIYLIGPRGRRTDVIVDVQNGIPFFSPLVRRRSIINLVHHVHHEQWQIIYPGPAGKIGWWLESRLAPRLYRRHPYVTVSDATRRELISLGIAADRITVVHNGVDAPAPERREPRADEPTICTLSRLVPHKQVEHALEAAAVVRRALPRLRVEIVGDGWWHESLTARATELGLDDAVTFHGAVSDARRDALLDRAWVLLAPSVKEGWGIAIMEAAAHGVPAIAYSSAGGVRESIVDGETGWLVADSAELEKRTEELLTDPTLRERMGANARARAAGFDWASTGRRFADLLDDLAD
ncbi:MAG TPA: glycosyltransferase family 4 protein [Jatrophihabitans sp.]|jgi:glycosyltransferase involved in cell wall biosynthesis|uniref:glycosyltransferase family 4 protein n=1 Tax=Jatrophihabitans sp. TaxID=1932789 RepID=UPI002E0352C5|nr:glycosyltransferase family 4 protein [Jatrophihabitans sp.]